MTKNSLKDNYFVLIPLIITVLIYLISITYGFRNFDENLIIKDFYTNKTFGEYIEKFLLINFSGATEARGFTFSSIKNTHVSVLGMPLFYIISFLFQAKPFLFHLWSLLLHCFTLYFFTMFCYSLTKNKNIALFSGLLWTLHPANVEPVIWATNWPQLLGGAFYFFTLKKVVTGQTSASLITGITAIQILFSEHTITLPIAIFFTVLYQSNSLKSALKKGLPAFLVIAMYSVLRSLLISKTVIDSNGFNLQDAFERLFFLSPQVFLHQLKLILFPLHLTIDQIDLLHLDKNILGRHHLFSVLIFISCLLIVFFIRKKFAYLSFGLLMYLVTFIPFSQIIPLYSVVAERYNYFGSAFVILGIIALLFQILVNRNKILISFLIVLSLLAGYKSFARITDWKNSSTLFLSTINTSKSILKKGIWTYNLALSQKDQNKKEELLNLSTNLLKLFIDNNNIQPTQSPILQRYELDTKSLLAKAAVRIASNAEILNKKEEQINYLLKALNFARENSELQALVYKSLGTYYFQVNDFNKAIECFDKSNKISPSPTLNYVIGLCYLKQNDLVNYEKHLKEAVSVITPYNISPFKTYGQFLEHQKKDFNGAAKYYKIATLLENSPEAYNLLGTIYLKQNKIDDGFKVVKNGLVGFPNNPSLLYLNGSIKINKGNLNSGINDLTKVALNDNSPKDIKLETCNILVNLFLKEKDLKKAREFNELALMTDPNNQEALNYQIALMLR